MSTFDIYIHGTPRGHQIWGSENSRDYIKTFYNHDYQATEKAFLQIDICEGNSFYTYVRQQNIFDKEGRPQAFFALTIGFHKAYCTNVYKLYQLFDVVYNKVCIGSILQQVNNTERFAVEDLTLARTGSNKAVETIEAVFTQKLNELIVPFLQKLSNDNTFDKTKKIFSLSEVDSPLFFDSFKKHSLIVSPSKQPAMLAYDTIYDDLKQILAQKNELSSSNAQLKFELESMSHENHSLSNELQNATALAEQKYKDKIKKLQDELTLVTQERDILKQKFEDASQNFVLINKPFLKVSKILGVNTQELGTKKTGEQEDLPKKVKNRKNKTTETDWFNRALLCLVLICCFFILFLIWNSSENNSLSLSNIPIENNTLVNKDTTSTIKTSENGIEYDLAKQYYDSWEECFINIKGGGDKLDVNKKYIVSFTKGGKPAYIPDGNWLIFVNEGELINDDDSFIIDNPQFQEKNLMIQYVVNGKPVKTRVCKIH